jgi:hypothetical protein
LSHTGHTIALRKGWVSETGECCTRRCSVLAAPRQPVR